MIEWRSRRYRPRPRDARSPRWRGPVLVAVVAAMVVVGVLRGALMLVLSRDPAPPPARVAAADPALAALPLIETPVVGPGDTLVVYLSGDNGWQKADKGFAHELAARGYPVVALDSLRYLSRPQGVSGAAADLSALIEAYARAWGRPRVILAGYSFGAGALALLTPRLDDAARARVRALVLIAPGAHAEVRLHDYSLFDLAGVGTPSLPQAVGALGRVPVICIHADGTDPCAGLDGARVRSRAVAASHTFKGHYADVAAAIVGAGG